MPPDCAFNGAQVMIPPWFTAQMARMADMKNPPMKWYADGRPASDPDICLRMWWEGMHDMPQAAVEAAVTYAIPRREWFPRPVELREDADVAAPRPAWREIEPEPLPESVVLGTLPTGARVVALSRYEAECPDCGDTGFAPAGERTVRRCGCWATNSVLIRKRESQRKYAEAKSR